MILAINGKISSGKDTIGKIIQELVLGHSDEEIQESILKNRTTKEQLEDSGWKVKKFADKLKDIVCLLINCTREQLEDQEFKNKELGEEWWYWYMERDGGYSPIILDYLTTTKKQLKNYEGLELIKPTPRFLLQFIGTNLLRNQLHPKIWVNALMSEYKLYKETKPFVNLTLKDEEYPNWLITDMRFPNEMDAVKKRGGITIRVNRPFINKCAVTVSENLKTQFKDKGLHITEEDLDKETIAELEKFSNQNQHESETALDNATFDYEIINDGTIEDLIIKVKTILKNENII